MSPPLHVDPSGPHRLSKALHGLGGHISIHKRLAALIKGAARKKPRDHHTPPFTLKHTPTLPSQVDMEDYLLPFVLYASFYFSLFYNVELLIP